MPMTTTDHIVSAIKAGLSAVPLGGAVASLIGDYIPSSTDRQIQLAIADLEARLSALETRLDLSSLNREEFAELFKSAYIVITRSHSDMRRRAAVNLIANILLRQEDPERLGYTEMDHFVRSLESLSMGALECVAHVYRDVPDPPQRIPKTTTFGVLANALDHSPDLLMGLLGELHSFNLVHLTGMPPVPTANYGNYPIQLTILGGRFVQRVVDWDPSRGVT